MKRPRQAVPTSGGIVPAGVGTDYDGSQEAAAAFVRGPQPGEVASVPSLLDARAEVQRLR